MDNISKEEILEKSKKENKGMDLIERESTKEGAQIALTVGIIISTILYILDFIIYGKLNYGYYLIFVGMQTALYMYKYIKSKTKSNMFIALLFGISFVLFTIIYILSLCNIL